MADRFALLRDTHWYATDQQAVLAVLIEEVGEIKKAAAVGDVATVLHRSSALLAELAPGVPGAATVPTAPNLPDPSSIEDAQTPESISGVVSGTAASAVSHGSDAVPPAPATADR